MRNGYRAPSPAGKDLIQKYRFPIQPPPLRGTSFHRKEGMTTRAPSLGRGYRAQRGGVGFLFLAAKPPPLCLPHCERRCVEKSGILVSLPSLLGKRDRVAVDRVLSYIVDLRRISPLFFIPLEPYPARSARHLPHAGKALSVGIVFSTYACICSDNARKAVFSFRCLPHCGRGTAQRWIGYSRISST